MNEKESNFKTTVRLLKKRLKKRATQRAALEARQTALEQTVQDLTAELEKEPAERLELVETMNRQHGELLDKYEDDYAKLNRIYGVCAAEKERLQQAVNAQHRDHRAAMQQQHEWHSANLDRMIREQSAFYEQQRADTHMAHEVELSQQRDRHRREVDILSFRILDLEAGSYDP
jgi:hypothetical protein